MASTGYKHREYPSKVARPGVAAKVCSDESESAQLLVMIDSCADLPLVGKRQLTTQQLKAIKTSKETYLFTTANGQVRTNEIINIYHPALRRWFKHVVLPDSPLVLGMGDLINKGFAVLWTRPNYPPLL